MNDTINIINNNITPSRYGGRKKTTNGGLCFLSSSISLTTYKTVVDISKKSLKNHPIKYYGLNLYDFNEVQIKLEKQKHFLNNSFIYDKMSNNPIPLSTITFSANVNPKRYYSEIQNRINTLSTKAKDNNEINFEVTLILHPSGAIKNAVISRSSGIIEIDALAKQNAFKASPYPRPPAEDMQNGFRYAISITHQKVNQNN